MAEHFDYQVNNRTPSIARLPETLPGSFPRTNRYSHHSVAPSTRTWVTSTQQYPPGPPTPQPINVPSPVQTLRPLPTPRAQAPLHVVNNPEPLNLDNDQGQGLIGDQPRLFAQQPSTFDPSFGALRPRKKKSFVGGFVKRIRRLPKSVFGYGAGAEMSDKSNSRPGATSDTATSVTGMSTGNTLPLYTSNPPTPVVAGPKPPGLNGYHRPHMVMSEPTIPESPLPSVVRLEDHKRPNPSFRVSPPSGEIQPEHNGQLFAADGDPYFEHSVSDGLPSNLANRTTVMLYNDQETQYYGRNSHAPTPTPPVVARQLSSQGLSYVSSEPLAPVRPTSFHSTHPHVPPPIEIPQATLTSAPGPRVSYASQAPTPRATPPSLIPGAVHSSSSAPHKPQLSQAQATDPPPTSQHVDPVGVPSSEPIQSPVSVHPNPGADYLKMTLSPEPTSHATVTSGTSYYDPSFSSYLNPVEKFFKTLYNMPWVSHNRVTVDYVPGEGLGRMKKRKFRPATSWYQSILSRSRRSSASLDLLSSGTGSQASPRHSLGMGVALALGSPLSGSRRSKTVSDKHRNTHNKSRHQSSSRRHDHRHHRHHYTNSSSDKRRRHTGTTMDSTDTGGNPKMQADIKPASSPLIPSMYPFQYPPYPYPAFSTFPMPLPFPASAPGVLSGHDPNQPPQMVLRPGERPAVPRGPRGEQQQPMLYAPAGYALNSYQSMMAPPQVYVLSSPTQMNASAPPKLAPSSNNNTSAGAGASSATLQQTLPAQGQQQSVNHSGLMFMQTIPGAFS
ncbi:hypothetical protein CVT25_009331 [Psilocybe cyanescens]|uniref:Uncharacterized protein n=1 Tax=Psilocybe cyanescens TaxID=93625 RepID=A0A409VN72_PSICY|nr:hypothetical protein CVT25_009331 [Psilocybe cyanescens]